MSRLLRTAAAAALTLAAGLAVAGTASAQAAALARGDTTALALCDAAIARIEAQDGARLPGARRGDLARQLTGINQPFSIRPEHIRFASGARNGSDVEISGLLHDIQYQGSATRYELKLDNGQTLNISKANNQWLDTSAQHQTGQRISARWAREAMTPLHDTAVGGV